MQHKLHSRSNDVRTCTEPVNLLRGLMPDLLAKSHPLSLSSFLSLLSLFLSLSLPLFLSLSHTPSRSNVDTGCRPVGAVGVVLTWRLSGGRPIGRPLVLHWSLASSSSACNCAELRRRDVPTARCYVSQTLQLLLSITSIR